MPDVELSVRPASPDDVDTAVDIAAAALQWRPGEPHAAFFRWKHLDNPAGRSPMWLACIGDEVAGFRAMMRWHFVLGDHPTIHGVRAVDTATHPDHRRRGVFRALTLAAVEELTAEGVDFVFNTPNPDSLAGYLTMGWHDEGRVPVRFFPTRLSGPLRTLRARVPAVKWSEPCPTGDPIDAVADELADRSRSLAEPRLRSLHDADQLRWRYGFEPLHYRVVRSDDAAAVFRLRRRGPARETVVAELFASSRRSAEAVLRRLRHEVDADHMILTARGPGPRPPLLPLPASGPVLTVRSLASTAPRLAELALSMGDLELF